MTRGEAGRMTRGGEAFLISFQYYGELFDFLFWHLSFVDSV
jgi:hypothetical protein